MKQLCVFIVLSLFLTSNALAQATTEMSLQALRLINEEGIVTPRLVVLTTATPDSTGWKIVSVDTIALEKPAVSFSTEWDSTRWIDKKTRQYGALVVRVNYKVNNQLTVSLVERLYKGDAGPREMFRAELSKPVNPSIRECWVRRDSNKGSILIEEIIEASYGNQSEREQKKPLKLKTLEITF
jgi:hypothetical protein